MAGSGRALGGLCTGSVGLLFSLANSGLAAQVECGLSWASVDGDVLAAPHPTPKKFLCATLQGVCEAESACFAWPGTPGQHGAVGTSIFLLSMIKSTSSVKRRRGQRNVFPQISARSRSCYWHPLHLLAKATKLHIHHPTSERTRDRCAVYPGRPCLGPDRVPRGLASAMGILDEPPPRCIHG